MQVQPKRPCAVEEFVGSLSPFLRLRSVRSGVAANGSARRDEHLERRRGCRQIEGKRSVVGGLENSPGYYLKVSGIMQLFRWLLRCKRGRIGIQIVFDILAAG